jgi:predicted TIM-barrel fold metal-dependent hydrolase
MPSILDFHTHAFPDALAQRAMAALQEAADWKAETDGTVRGLVELMDRHGVARAVVASIATKPEQAPKILDWSLAIQSDRIVPFGSVHPRSAHVAEEVQAVASAGLRGIKLHPLYQNFAVDDPVAFPLYEAIAESGLVVLFHAGLDIAFGDVDLAMPRRFVRVVERFPKLRLVLAHLGGWRAYDEFLATLAGSHVCIETSFAVPYCTPAQRDAILERHAHDRILFGSDSPWSGLAREIAFVKDFPVPEATREAIFHGNAERLLGLKAEE